MLHSVGLMYLFKSGCTAWDHTDAPLTFLHTQSLQEYSDLVQRQLAVLLPCFIKEGARRRNKSNVIEKINKSNGNCGRRSPNGSVAGEANPESGQTN